MAYFGTQGKWPWLPVNQGRPVVRPLYDAVLRKEMAASTLWELILEDLDDFEDDQVAEAESFLESFLESFRRGFEAGALLTYPAWAHMPDDALAMIEREARRTRSDISNQCYHAGRAAGFKWAASVDGPTREALSLEAAACNEKTKRKLEKPQIGIRPVRRLLDYRRKSPVPYASITIVRDVVTGRFGVLQDTEQSE